MKRIILIGGGGHARSVADSIRQAGQYVIAGFIDLPSLKGKLADGIAFIGTDDDLQKIYDAGIRQAFVAIGYMGEGNLREQLYEKLKRIGFKLPIIIDPSAVLAKNVKVDEGTYIGKRAVVNANAAIGRLCIVNTGVIVEHDNCVDDFSHLAVGSVLCGHVRVGKGCLIGAGATVIQKLDIGDRSIVGAGITVRHSIGEGQIYYGT